MNRIAWTLPAIASLILPLGCLYGPDLDPGPAPDAPSQAEYIAALPDADRLRPNLPTGGVPAVAGDNQTGMSDFYLFTHDVTDDVNDFIFEVLDTVNDITSYDGEWVDDYTLAWGPIEYSPLDPCVSYLAVTWNQDGTYEWFLMEWPKNGDQDDGVVDAWGIVDPYPNPSDSTGAFWIDFDTMLLMDPTREASGQVYVEYLLDVGIGAAQAWFDGFAGVPGDDTVDAYYAFTSEQSGAGEMLFGFVADLNETGTDEVMAVHSRWDDQGAGRSDSTVTAGDLGETQAHISECWGADFAMVYHGDDAGWTEPSGDEALCSFNPGEWPDLSDLDAEQNQE